jgi:hypothetical protein
MPFMFGSCHILMGLLLLLLQLRSMEGGIKCLSTSNVVVGQAGTHSVEGGHGVPFDCGWPRWWSSGQPCSVKSGNWNLKTTRLRWHGAS